jgi:alpha-ribazole phosphatase
MVLYLVRHPQPDLPSGICYGQLDVPVGDDVITLALSTLTPQLQPLGGDIRLVSSPLRRCQNLADAIALQLNLPSPEIDDRLQEIAFGDWEGLQWNDISREQIDAWAVDISGYAPPQGESAQLFQQRVLNWLESLNHCSATPMIAVTHAGVIRALLGFVQALPIEQWSILPIDYASLTILPLPRKIAAHV